MRLAAQGNGGEEGQMGGQGRTSEPWRATQRPLESWWSVTTRNSHGSRLNQWRHASRTVGSMSVLAMAACQDARRTLRSCR
ncbi:hypothetical protein BaRGS_00012268 [Batillaria attramentaria]|uniref:Uncharacterized protein n=1 Tax=Batillaria attramentaria TaxID=370345 RepID=A0ABD0LAM4_9CAEN